MNGVGSLSRLLRKLGRVFVALGVLLGIGSCAGVAHADAGNGLKYWSAWGPTCDNTAPGETFGSAGAALHCWVAGQQADWMDDPAPWPLCAVVHAEEANEPPGTDATSWLAHTEWGDFGCPSGYAPYHYYNVTLYRAACVGSDYDPGGPCAPEEPSECDMGSCPVGTHFSEESGAGEVCLSSCGCRLVETGNTNGVRQFHNTGEGCSGTEDEPPEDLTTEETCTAVGTGEYCLSSAGDGQCGYLNDSYVCLQNVRGDECKALGDGGRICGPEASSTPPVPDNGTPGELAAPDGTVEQTTTGGESPVTNVYNYYGPTTVAGSSRDPGETGASAASVSGSPHAPSPGDEDGDGEQDCATGCTPGTPSLEDVGTMGEAFSGFWSDLQAVPIVAAASEVAPSFGAGSCPVWADSFSVFGQSIEVDFGFICSTWEDVSPALTIVALVLWGVVAFRILMSA